MSGARILIAAKFFSEGFGGTPESILLLARLLAPLGGVCDAVIPKGLTLDVQNLAGLPAFPGAGSIPRKSLDITRYDAVFVAGPWNFHALRIAARARQAGIPVSYGAKGGLADAEFRRPRDIKKFPYLFTFETALLAMADRIIFSSPAERDHFVPARTFWNHKYAVVPEPFVPPMLGLRDRQQKAAIVLGFMAEIAPRKGLRELIEGFALMLSRHPDTAVILRVAGAPRPGSEAYLQGIRAFVEKSGIGAKLEWLGPVRNAAGRQAFYDDLHIFLCPSKFESFGLTPLEALWHGVPVALGQDVGSRAYIPAEAPVIAFEKIAAPEIASTIRLLIAQRDALYDKGAAWRGRTIPALTGEALARQFLSTLTLGSPAV